MSQSSMTPRERSNEPTPLNRAPASPARTAEPAPSAPAAPASPSAPPREEALAAPAPRSRSGLSRFVLIGEDLDQAALQRAFDAALGVSSSVEAREAMQ